MNESSFTGRRRDRTTTWAVKFGDSAAQTIITFGGIGTIIAVIFVALFLVGVVSFLFIPGDVEQEVAFSKQTIDTAPLHMAVDEHQILAWAIFADGKLRVFRLDNGELINEKTLFTDKQLTAASFPLSDSRTVLGFADGSVKMFDITFDTNFIEPEDVPERLRDMTTKDVRPLGSGMVQFTSEEQYRQRLVAFEPILEQSVADGPIRLLDHTASSESGFVGVYAETPDPGKRFQVHRLIKDQNMMTLETKTSLGRSITLEIPDGQQGEPKFLRTAAQDNVYLIWEDGHTLRYSVGQVGTDKLAETLDLAAGSDKLAVADFVLAQSSLITGTYKGEMAVWFPIRPSHRNDIAKYTRSISDEKRHFVFHEGSAALSQFRYTGEINEPYIEDGAGPDGLDIVAPSPDTAAYYKTHTGHDGFTVVRAKTLYEGDGAAVRSIAPSVRTRMFAASFDDGMVRVIQVTSNKVITEANAASGRSIDTLAISPKEDGLLAAAGNQYEHWQLDLGYPEATASSLFLPVWYDGAETPRQVWQSTGGTDEFEPKLSLVPLIFGTFKATFYALLFGAPLAIAAAIFTSEFLHPKVKTKVKPAIELMASLPSVVLGFFAGLVFAEYVEDHAIQVIAAIVTVPLALLGGAFLWQMVPIKRALILSQLGAKDMEGEGAGVAVKNRLARFIFQLGGIKLILMALSLVVGVYLAFPAGRVFEDLLFGGSFLRWLAGAREVPIFGGAVGGWMILTLPLCAVGTIIFLGRVVHPWLRVKGRTLDRRQMARLDLLKFILAILVAVGVAFLLAAMLSMVGFDPRGSYVDTYVQRNSLVVGFAMGFAIIPIIYTIAEDALSTVPEHLRSASLGSGATPWQTATRVVIPTAMSGMFSALMIGLGRAVGETMIVLMALGNTPIMEWNIFNGARTLSANIAVELPEAVKGSTHYRTLFLCGLVLFTLTFVVNTVAEFVRQRFRKRAYQL